MSFSDRVEKMIDGAKAGLYQGATIVMAESQAIVPVEFGTLKRSGVVEEPVEEGDAVTVTVGYGYGTETGPDGETADQYALYVHEIARYKHAPPTTYKFLERPARAFEPELGPLLKKNIEARTETP